MKFEGRYKNILLGALVGGILGALLVKPHQSDNLHAVRSLIQPLWPSLALYAIFGIYWTVAARNSAATESSEHWASTALHQVIVNAALLLMFIRVPGLQGRFLPNSPLVAPFGIAIQAAATALAFWARIHLGRNWSAEVSAKVGHQLIRTGPYKWLRHPIYTGIFGIHLGIMIASGEWHALLGFALLPFTYARKIMLEERTMERLFHSDYEAYRRDSWALIPWVL